MIPTFQVVAIFMVVLKTDLPGPRMFLWHLQNIAWKWLNKHALPLEKKTVRPIVQHADQWWLLSHWWLFLALWLMPSFESMYCCLFIYLTICLQLSLNKIVLKLDDFTVYQSLRHHGVNINRKNSWNTTQYRKSLLEAITFTTKSPKEFLLKAFSSCRSSMEPVS